MIEIVPYQPEWPTEFFQIGQDLRLALGSMAIRIDHIGSTAVPGLAAKDRIDIQVTVAALTPDIEVALINIGYTRREFYRDHAPAGAEGKPEEWRKWFFAPPTNQRPANLHVRVAGRANQRYARLFRDFLREHAHTAQAYAELKRRLAQHLSDPKSYPDVKDPAVDLIFFAAEEWARATQWRPWPLRYLVPQSR